MNTKQKRNTIGADPEFMLVDRHQSKVVSAIPVLKQDKHNPIDLGDGIKMYSDNVLVETSFPPSVDRFGFLNTLRAALVRMQEKLGDRYFLMPKTSHVYDATELGPKPDIMKGKLPVEWEIGCNPSWNVYTCESAVPDPFKDGLRTGSFHVHVGSGQLVTPVQKMLGVRLLDIFLGCASVIWDRDDTSLARRVLYGRAGEFRPTPYGLEYRVMGAFSLCNPRAVELVWDLVDHAMELINLNEAEDIINSVDPSLVQAAINQNKPSLAGMVLREAGMPSALTKRIEADYTANMYNAWKI